MFRQLRTIGCFVALFTCSTPAQAQFFLNGSATLLNDSCFQLTPAQNWASGSIWYPDKISLAESFEAVVEVNLGCKNQDGADGIVFGFQPVSTSIGIGGGAIGFGGVVPSLGIELDTYQNTDLGDPAFDHIAIVSNGVVNHNSANNLAGPVQANNSNPNIEDCQFHDLRVSWNATTKLLRVYLDCQLRLNYTGDLVQNLFGGNPEVFWGFTSATGGLNNTHQVCFQYTTFLNQLQDLVMCPGAQVQLQARGGVSYRWTPEAGLSNPGIYNPIASPTQTTTYTVEISDACGQIFYDDLILEVLGDSLQLDIGPDTFVCEGQSLRLNATATNAVYQWSDGSGNAFLDVVTPGLYEVTVTKTDTFCIGTDQINISGILQPEASLGSDTTLCTGQTLPLHSAAPQNVDYLWQNGSTADTLLVSSPGLYRILTSNACGEAEDDVRIAFESCREVYIPNVFSPNSDGINDRFFLQDGGDVTAVLQMRIFDRWGGMVFEQYNFLPNNSALGWDGRFRGKPASEGAYAWFAALVFRDGKQELFSGTLTLVR
ncbi:MAG: gliding motility-associated C-terminal domain-containing protein [Saprospiraceae bacterium]|nr:gliding motility-associated C-terminal domain-containing protein [Saprospiraceae bacterium]MDZ4702402.1 gliding motility-associated C-terminal domain-containing protein [Saprospiraceae bacterium]